MRFHIIILFALLISCQQKTSSVDVAELTTSSNKIFFKNIKNGDTLVSPFIIEMGVIGMKIKPAGVLEAGTGHHHLLINQGFMDYGKIIPMDKQHIHYGKGDTVAEVNLPSGQHTLTLQFANGMHASYGEHFSNTISVYVK